MASRGQRMVQAALLEETREQEIKQKKQEEHVTEFEHCTHTTAKEDDSNVSIENTVPDPDITDFAQIKNTVPVNAEATSCSNWIATERTGDMKLRLRKIKEQSLENDNSSSEDVDDTDEFFFFFFFFL
ncbi:hypothetical protein J6590_106314 [Homalodisca vitripennis]|nr:hypothetical protein J6590_086405 [Homalodisca vitripennis]KAG8274510.1 hypothetical protein J6590_106314 [Homalodisca vitripennis]